MESTSPRNMPPEEILERLRRRGITQAGLARDLGHKSLSTIHREIYSRPNNSHRVRCHIALALDLPVTEVFPECYPDGEPTPPRIGRPKTPGVFDKGCVL